MTSVKIKVNTDLRKFTIEAYIRADKRQKVKMCEYSEEFVNSL